MATIKLFMLCLGSVITIFWGIAHVVPVNAIVKGFGRISADNRRIITMEWVSEGLTLCFIGFLVLLMAALGGGTDFVPLLVLHALAAMLVVMAVWTQLTGAKTKIIWIKICPIVKTAAAVLIFIGSLP